MVMMINQKKWTGSFFMKGSPTFSSMKRDQMAMLYDSRNNIMSFQLEMFMISISISNVFVTQ